MLRLAPSHGSPIPGPGLAVGLLIAGLALAGCTAPEVRLPLAPPTVVDVAPGTPELLQAVSVVTEDVIWASGHGATWVRTIDGGERWEVGTVPGPAELQLRDVHAADALTAWVLAAGPGELSRIYRTDNGGTSWTLQWTNPEPDGFYDCIAFWDRRRGVLYGDAVASGLRILVTADGGARWDRVPEDALPAALPGEGGFAASGLCVDTGSDGRAWIAAGNTVQARVFRTADWGGSWRAARAPVEAGEGAGLTAISMVDHQRGFAFGGALGETTEHTRNVVRTHDGGATWSPLPPVSFPGPVYGGLAVPGTRGQVLVAVGPGGAAVSLDAGGTWTTVDERSWWAVGSSRLEAAWIAGPEGRLARLAFPARGGAPAP